MVGRSQLSCRAGELAPRADRGRNGIGWLPRSTRSTGRSGSSGCRRDRSGCRALRGLLHSASVRRTDSYRSTTLQGVTRLVSSCRGCGAVLERPLARRRTRTVFCRARGLVALAAVYPWPVRTRVRSRAGARSRRRSAGSRVAARTTPGLSTGCGATHGPRQCRVGRPDFDPNGTSRVRRHGTHCRWGEPSCKGHDRDGGADVNPLYNAASRGAHTAAPVLRPVRLRRVAPAGGYPRAGCKVSRVGTPLFRSALPWSTASTDRYPSAASHRLYGARAPVRRSQGRPAPASDRRNHASTMFSDFRTRSIVGAWAPGDCRLRVFRGEDPAHRLDAVRRARPLEIAEAAVVRRRPDRFESSV